MKTKFPEHFKLSEDTIKELWENAMFVFDANILLNLYRYSENTKKEFLKILDKISERLWIPHQSGKEFLGKRLTVISQQEKAYKEAINQLKSNETLFIDSRKHPFIEVSSLEKLRALYGDMYKELEGKKDFYSKRLTNDDILEIIGEYFTERVGDEFDKDTYTALCEEAEKRYANRTPPGYKDAGKDDGSDSDIKKYGDYILWKQVIEKSKTSNQNVIFVTDDKKEDWWLEQSGKTIGPRPELIKEFQEETHQLIYMYQSDRFFEYANSYYNESVDKVALDEIRELVNLDGKRREKHEALNFKRELISNKELERLYNEKLMLEKELEELLKRRNNWSERLLELHSHMDNQNINETDFDSYKTHREKILLQLHSIEQRIGSIRSRLDMLKDKGFRTREFRY